MREGVGVIDRSMLGKVTVTGRDRQAFLQGMLTNDVKGLTAGKGTGAAFLDALGKVMVLLSVYALDDRLLIELPPSLTEKTLERLDHFLISEKVYFEAADSAFAIIAVQGPAAGDLLSRLAGQTLDLAPYEHVEVVIAGEPVRVIHRREGGVAGFHCWTAAAHGAALWAAIADGRGARGHAGARHAPRRGGCSLVRPGRRRDADLSRDAARAARELHQGLLYRPGGRGAREVPRPHQPRALRPGARGRSGSRRRARGSWRRARTSAASPRPCGPSPSADPSRSATCGASTSSRAAPSTSMTAAWSSGRRSRRCPFVEPAA